MKIKTLLFAVFLFLFSTYSCHSQKSNEPEVRITISTEYGDIKLKLYNETPQHRDNFVKLIKNGFYSDRIFHRVINNFMIQGGDALLPNGSNNKSGTDYNYTVPAEVNQNFYHKKGALAAARMGDEVNPNRESSSTQFYIVQGQVLSYPQITQVENQINNQLIKDIFIKYIKEEENRMLKNDSAVDYKSIQKNAATKAKADFAKNPFKFSEEQIKTYTTLGGTPFLDMTYTVFGEVTEGLEVVDKIAAVKTLPGDRPEKDIKFTITISE